MVLISVPLALAAACSSNAGSGSASSGAAAEGVPKAAAGATGSGGGDASSGTVHSDAGTGGSVLQGANTAPAAKDLIITAGIQVKTADAARAAAQAEQIATAAGGYVASESVGSGSQPVPQPQSSAGGSVPGPATLPDVNDDADTIQAVLVLRVPPQQVDSVLKQLGGKGSVTYQNRSATDVTGQVADVASRVTSAQAAIAELRTMIDKAASMNDLISLEQALAQRESDLESLEAQQKALADQVQYATITVGYFSHGTTAAPPPPPATGFTRGLTVGWHAFTRTVRGFLAAVGWLLPFAGLVAIGWWPVRRIWRLAGRRRRTPAAAASPETEAS
jgi:hypothetical protein